MAEEWGNHLVLYLYDADGSPVGMQYRNTSYAAGQFDTFWFEKNLQGDVVAVYNHSGIKLIAYTYDAWGNSSVSYYNSGASTTATYNPFRYRGYYLDSESGFYYLNSRYYDPAIGRFITADKLSTIKATSFDLVDKNLYAYCDNNPITRTDDSGAIWETVFDIVSLGVSVVEVCVNPTDPWAWAGLVGDAVDLIPFVTGVGEVTRAVKTTKKIVDGVDNVVDAAKATYKAADAASDIRKATGTYEILYKSGKNYVGKGGFKRAISSAVRNADKYGDEVVSIMWKSNKNGVGAFLEEYALQTIRGVNNASTYNKIWSPGKKLYKALFG